MAARIDALAKAAAHAADPDAGARAAAALLRSSWCEAPIGRILELRSIARSHDVIALVESGGQVSATIWDPLSSSLPLAPATHRRASYAGDKWT
jgi:hypothetical protein